MRILHVSDTHNAKPDLPASDILVHSGDLTNLGSEEEVLLGLKWLSEQKSEHKLFVPGNHDLLFDQDHPDGFDTVELAALILRAKDSFGIDILTEGTVDYFGLKFGAMARVKKFGGWAFGSSEFEISESLGFVLPFGIDVLVTHTPPFGILDHNGLHRCGSETLYEKVRDDKSIMVHLFGHIHESAGVYPPVDDGGKTFVNSAQSANMITLNGKRIFVDKML